MALLFRRLQIWGACPYRLQQPFLFYGYKKHKPQTDLLGLKALLISFLNQLLLGQGKCGSIYLIKVSAKKPE